MKVSVIVPVYNVADYVGACLQSIIGQDYTDLEILAVDDGSTDGSGEICDAMAAEDPRIRVIHTPNRGVSSARNTCLQAATGEYITSVDSDDLILPGFFSAMVSACEEYHVDASVCDLRRVDQDYILKRADFFDEEGDGEAGNMPQPDPESIPDSGAADGECNREDPLSASENTESRIRIFTPQECLEHIYHPISTGMSFATCGKLYRRFLYEKARTQYPAGRIHEDVATTYQLLYRAERIAYLPKELYLYRFREGSIMHRPFYEERLAAAEATRGQCDFFLKEGERQLAALAINNHIRTMFSLLANVRESEDTQETDKKRMEKRLLRELREDCDRYLPQADLSPARKAMFCTAARVPADVLVRRLRMF